MFKYILYFFFLIIKIALPTNHNLIIFGHRAGRRFGDNSRFLFMYYNKFKKKKRPVWITKNRLILKRLKKLGYEAYLRNSFKGIYLCLRAKWHVYDCTEDDIHESITKISNNVNLWHGILFKKLKKHNNTYLGNKFFSISKLFFKKYIVYPNKIFSKHLINHYPKNKYKLIISNSPRNILFKNKVDNKYFTLNNERKIAKDLQISKKKVIGYFPTWRLNGMEIFPKNTNKREIIELNNFLIKKKILLVIKKHPNSFKEDKHRLYNKKQDEIYSFLSNQESFYVLKYDIDLNSIMHKCDALISDYSGAIFDFLLSEKPIIFFTPDLTEYKIDPGLNFDIKKISISPIAKNFSELKNEIIILNKNKFKISKKYKKKLTEFKNKVFYEKECFNNIVNILN